MNNMFAGVVFGTIFTVTIAVLFMAVLQHERDREGRITCKSQGLHLYRATEDRILCVKTVEVTFP